MSTGSPSRHALELRHLSKTFAGQLALDDVSLTVRGGEIHALLGQNGSGKSTLIKLLAGYHDADPGAEVVFDGAPVELGRTGSSHGWRRHVHFIHQDLALVESLSAVENIALERGFRTNRFGAIDWRAERARAQRLFAEFDVDIEPSVPVRRLSQPERAMVAIVRALQDWDAEQFGVLVLDEPTASLSAPEAQRLFAAVRRVAQRGAGVLFVSHRLEEVFELADRVTVLRDGRRVGTEEMAGMTDARLVSLIVGRHVEDLAVHLPEPREDVAVEVGDLSGGRVASLSLQAHRGEVIGIAGLVGSGREDVASLIFGALPDRRGRVAVGGTAVADDPRASLRAGVKLVPADRAAHGIIPGFPLRENLTLPYLEPLRHGAAGGWRIRRRRERAEAARWISELDIRPGQPERKLGAFSGGNQQKVVMARCLRAQPKVLLLDEPTQGVDVGARAQIYALIADAAAEGLAVILCSSHSAELANLCDRVLVMREGRVAATLSGAALTETAIAAAVLRPSPASRPTGTPVGGPA